MDTRSIEELIDDAQTEVAEAQMAAREFGDRVDDEDLLVMLRNVFPQLTEEQREEALRLATTCPYF